MAFICNLQPNDKPCCVESQLASLVWRSRVCLSLTEKQRTVNHTISFNDLISKFYQYSEAFADAYLCFLVPASAKKKKKKKAGGKKILRN